MEIFKYLIMTVVGISLFVILILAVRTKKAFRFITYNSVLSLFVFCAIYFTKKYTGIFLPLNIFTAIGTLGFGVPFIVGFLMLNLII